LDKHPENVKSTSFLEKLISLFRWLGYIKTSF
jgi:hypothetical protein